MATVPRRSLRSDRAALAIRFMMRIATLLALGARALHELAAPWPQHRCLFDLGGAEDEVEEDGLVIVGYPHHDDPLSLLAQALGHRQRGRHAAAVLALGRSEEHPSELQSLMRISYAVFCLKKKIQKRTKPT